MFKMTALFDTRGNVTVSLKGNVSADVVPEIDRLVRDGQRAKQQIVLDLSEVTLIDPAAARFFAALLSHGVELADCPNYLKPWISPESVNEPEY
ncbi:MAG TPA: STAS domain-containing protein [Bryobacteraceae bacterium]|jgi:anti-anti-sigma regulatory factor|nr:STAS domain-containing protein [Bryobacteraceae bacterium]